MNIKSKRPMKYNYFTTLTKGIYEYLSQKMPLTDEIRINKVVSNLMNSEKLDFESKMHLLNYSCEQTVLNKRFDALAFLKDPLNRSEHSRKTVILNLESSIIQTEIEIMEARFNLLMTELDKNLQNGCDEKSEGMKNLLLNILEQEKYIEKCEALREKNEELGKASNSVIREQEVVDLTENNFAADEIEMFKNSIETTIQIAAQYKSQLDAELEKKETVNKLNVNFDSLNNEYMKLNEILSLVQSIINSEKEIQSFTEDDCSDSGFVIPLDKIVSDSIKTKTHLTLEEADTDDYQVTKTKYQESKDRLISEEELLKNLTKYATDLEHDISSYNSSLKWGMIVVGGYTFLTYICPYLLLLV